MLGIGHGGIGILLSVFLCVYLCDTLRLENEYTHITIIYLKCVYICRKYNYSCVY